LRNEFEDVQNKQQEIINRDINILRSNLTTTTNNLASKIEIVDQKLNSTQEKQLKLTSDLRDHGHGNKHRLDQLTSKIENFKNEFKLIDQQIENFQQTQIELSRLGEENGQTINFLRTNLTHEMHRLDEKLNSTQQKQLELTTDIRNHGHGNKQRIDQLTSQINNFISHDVLERKMNLSLTNITFYMDQIQRQAFENISSLSSQMNITTEKVGSLWLNFLDGKNLISPILQKYVTYAESIGAKDPPQNRTDNIRQEIDRLVNEKAEYKRIVTDRIPDSLSVKLHPINSNLKKVKAVSLFGPLKEIIYILLQGVLMVKHNNQWGTVCDDGLEAFTSSKSLRVAQSACHTLGLSGGSMESYMYTGSEAILLDDINCASSTTNFLECSHRGWGTENCGNTENVLLTCT